MMRYDIGHRTNVRTQPAAGIPMARTRNKPAKTRAASVPISNSRASHAIAADPTRGTAAADPATEAEIEARVAAEVDRRFARVAEMLGLANDTGLTEAVKSSVPAAAAPKPTGPNEARLATKEELDAVALAAFDQKPNMKSFLDEMAIAEAPTPAPPPNRRPPDAPERRRPGRKKATKPPAPRRPDAPLAPRRERAADRLNALKLRRAQNKRKQVRPGDWMGASNVGYARCAAKVLRDNGRPMWPKEICAEVTRRFGYILHRAERNLPPLLRGSRIQRMGPHHKIWFAGEAPPARPSYQRRDTPAALTRELAETTFERASAILKAAGPAGMTVQRLAEKIGEDLADFNRDWLRQRLKRAAKDPSSHIRKVERGYAYRTARAGNGALSIYCHFE